MKKNSTTQINSEYEKLKSAIKRKLKKTTELDIDDFYSHIISIFEPEDVAKIIPDMSTREDVDKVFKVLTKNRLWGFGDVSQLASIADRFIEGDDSASIQQMIQGYRNDLSGYRATTKIVDWMLSNELKERDDDEDEMYESVASNPDKYSRKYRRKLSAKLFKDAEGRAQLTMKSLEYIERIWNNLCAEFDISSLSAVLDDIQTGCIQVTWLISPPSASKVLDHIGEAVEFLRSKFISIILIEDIIIYNESCGVTNQQVRDLGMI